MKATEIRVNNLVLTGGNEQFVVSIDIDDPQDPRINDCQEIAYQPIPLTDEWLVKLGMVKRDGWDDTILWRRNEDEMIQERFELMETIHGYEAPSGKIIESVHILQNAYYFHTLTGEELTTI